MKIVFPGLILSLLLFACDRDPAPDPGPEAPKVEPAPVETDDVDNRTEAQKSTETPEQPESPDGLGPGTEEQQQALIRAKAAFLTNNWEDAEKEFEALTKIGPVTGPQVTAYIALGKIYEDSERADEAQALYDDLLKKAPDVAEVHFVVARSLAERGETTPAMRAYERTLKLQPNYVQALVELGALYVKAGRGDEAKAYYHQYEKQVYALATKLESKETPAEEKLELLEIFSFVDDDRASAAVVTCLGDPHPAVRDQAVLLVGELGIAEVVPRLETMAETDPDVRVRMSARVTAASLAKAVKGGAAPKFVKKKSQLPGK